MIREALIDDLVPLLILIRNMLDESAYAGLPFDAEIAAETVVVCIRRPDRLALVVEQDGVLEGFLLAKTEQTWFGPARIATDLMVYTTEQARRQGYHLERQYVAWARRRASRIQTLNVSNMDDTRWQRAMGRLGYHRAGSIMEQGADE